MKHWICSDSTVSRSRRVRLGTTPRIIRQNQESVRSFPSRWYEMSGGNADLMRSNESTTAVCNVDGSEAAAPWPAWLPVVDPTERWVRVYAIAYLARIGERPAGRLRVRYTANGASDHVIWLIVSGFASANSLPVLWPREVMLDHLRLFAE